jgi:hypothetical protein
LRAIPRVTPDSGEASQKRSLRLMESRGLSIRAGWVHKKLPIWVTLIDLKPLTRRSIEDLLAKPFHEYVMIAASTCEELLEIDERRIGRPNLVVVYVRDVGLTNTWVKERLSSCGCGSPRPQPLCLLTGTMLTKSTAL